MPRKPTGEPHWRVLAVKLPPALHDQLRQYCWTHRLAISDAIRAGITRLFKDEGLTSIALKQQEADAAAHAHAVNARLAETDSHLAALRAHADKTQRRLDHARMVDPARLEQVIDALLPAVVHGAQTNDQALLEQARTAACLLMAAPQDMGNTIIPDEGVRLKQCRKGDAPT